jgi:orotate phosphoribosyltransferase
MNSSEVLKLFEESGALLKGHFKLTSGRHSDVYYEKFALLKNPAICTKICMELATHFEKENVQTVVGPTLGGVIIAYEVARYLGIVAAYAEQGESGRIFKRDFALAKGERVLIVDDVLTTGTSVNEVIELVKQYGAEIVGIGIILDRSGAKVKFDYPFFAVSTIAAESWDTEECPICKKGVPLTQRGSRKS